MRDAGAGSSPGRRQQAGAGLGATPRMISNRMVARWRGDRLRQRQRTTLGVVSSNGGRPRLFLASRRRRRAAVVASTAPSLPPRPSSTSAAGGPTATSDDMVVDADGSDPARHRPRVHRVSVRMVTGQPAHPLRQRGSPGGLCVIGADGRNDRPDRRAPRRPAGAHSPGRADPRSINLYTISQTDNTDLYLDLGVDGRDKFRLHGHPRQGH